ncbi:hypothetical protein LCGC14_1306830 [marine sediment metagenome]|uniref:Uncharacterized protein n=1 Tax=marine sediment metagenome TaxID=412755 RepID=A0A0F9L895_9ZZZZ
MSNISKILGDPKVSPLEKEKKCLDLIREFLEDHSPYHHSKLQPLYALGYLEGCLNERKQKEDK